MKLGIIRLYMGDCGKVGYYNVQEVGLAKALLNKGVETDIFFLNKSEHKDVVIHNISDGIRVIYISALKFGNHGIVNPSFILNYKLDIVHLLSDNQLMAPTFIKFCKKNGIPIYNYVGTIYSSTSNKIKKAIMNFTVKRNIKYFKESLTIAKTIEIKKVLESKGVKKVKLIPVGLDLDIIPESEKSKKELRKELKLPFDKKILIFVGRLEECKKPLQAIEIIRELNSISDNYYLVIIGQGSMKDKVVYMIDKYNLNNNIMSVDKIENSKIHSYYRSSDIFLNFSTSEIFGMSILEAMYNKCKVIAVKAPGPNFIIDNNVNGIIVDDLECSKWVDKIMDEEDNEKISELANEKILNEFNWHKIADTYIKMFDDISFKKKFD